MEHIKSLESFIKEHEKLLQKHAALNEKYDELTENVKKSNKRLHKYQELIQKMTAIAANPEASEDDSTSTPSRESSPKRPARVTATIATTKIHIPRIIRRYKVGRTCDYCSHFFPAGEPIMNYTLHKKEFHADELSAKQHDL